MSFFCKQIPWQEAETVFVALFAHKDNVFWLDSSRAEKGLARFSYMGQGTDASKVQKNIFGYLEEQLCKRTIPPQDVPFLFHGGFVGYFDYELKNSLWLYVDSFLVFDHQEHVLYSVGRREEEDSKNFKFQISNFKFPKKKLKIESKKNEITFHLSRSHKQYLKDIAVCKEYLKKGESYQICLTNTLTADVSLDPFDLYLCLRKRNPVPYGAYMRLGGTTILCASPEKFLSVDEYRWVETKPIKGTSRRSDNRKEDARLAQKLLASKKNRAENVMITDLLRNDLGKVCETGSVSVAKLLAGESYQSVHHLVSTIRGKLRKDMSVLDCIRACFPGGSMTGAPKLRTIEILKEIEKKPRGIYSGALGFLSVSGTAELNIIIRTIVQQGDRLSIGTGGAILFDSDPQEEYDEMVLKATPLMEAVAEAACTHCTLR